MDISNKTIWQQAAGDTDRNCVKECLDWGVILNGPGYAGKYPGCIGGLSENGTSKKKITDLNRFCKEMKNGDIVVLRFGTGQIYAVGTIAGDYLYSDLFVDVDGWDLQHVRRVVWYWKTYDDPKSFDIHTLKFGDTTQKLTSEKVSSWIKQLRSNTEQQLPELPKEGEVISLTDISGFLSDKGIDNAVVKDLSKKLIELAELAKWYKRSKLDPKPSEHETLTFFTIPLLLALGWTPQQIAIERIETSCLKAVSQAKTYATKQGREKCGRLIVTDGLRYAIFERSNGNFDRNPSAYLNLTEYRKSYPIYGCGGAREALLLMSPDYNKKRTDND